MNYNIIKEIEHQIYDAIDKHLEEYLNGTTFGTRHAREILTKNDFESYFDKKKMTLKERQELIVSELFQSCYDEWRDSLGDDLMEIMYNIVSNKHQKTMEDLFGERFVKMAHLFIDAKKLLIEIEELDDE